MKCWNEPSFVLYMSINCCVGLFNWYLSSFCGFFPFIIIKLMITCTFIKLLNYCLLFITCLFIYLSISIISLSIWKSCANDSHAARTNISIRHFVREQETLNADILLFEDSFIQIYNKTEFAENSSKKFWSAQKHLM